MSARPELIQVSNGVEYLRRYRYAQQKKHEAKRSRVHHHVSDLLREIGITSGLLEWEDKQDLEKVELLLAEGLAWEDYLSKVYDGDIEFHPGELRHGLIAGNPDGFEYAKDGLILHEFKRTYRSAGTKDPLDYWYWMSQCKSYAQLMKLVLGEYPVSVTLHVDFVNGDYKRQGTEPALYHIYEFRLSESICNATWRQMTRLADEKGPISLAA